MLPANQATVGAVLQKIWKEAAQEFADCISTRCLDNPRHSGRAVRYDLDDCSADEDGTTNYYYGRMSAVTEMARDLGIKLNDAVPAARSYNTRGRK